MNVHGYQIAGNSKSVDTNFIPSLIGIDEQSVNPNGTDTYFDRTEFAYPAHITSIEFTRWVCYDSLPLQQRDPILGVRSAGSKPYYIPRSELVEQATEAGDTVVLDMIAGLSRNRRP